MPEQDSQSDVDPRQDTGTDDDQNPLAMAEIDNDWGSDQDDKDQPGFLKSTPAPAKLGSRQPPHLHESQEQHPRM